MRINFDGPAFIKALRENALDGPLVLTGYVKQHVTEKDALLFSSSGKNETWVTIPASLLEKVDLMAATGQTECGYPQVTITCKKPATENAEASLFASLLKGDKPGIEKSDCGCGSNLQLFSPVLKATSPNQPVVKHNCVRFVLKYCIQPMRPVGHDGNDGGEGGGQVPDGPLVCYDIPVVICW